MPTRWAEGKMYTRNGGETHGTRLDNKRMVNLSRQSMLNHHKEILQDPNIDPAQSDSDWRQGYCYQIWRCRHNGFRADGKDGQFIVVLPEQKAVVVLTANIGNMQAELNLVWEHLLPALK